MPWSAALLFLACAFALLCVSIIWACAYFHAEKYEIRAIKRVRRKRRQAIRFLNAHDYSADRHWFSDKKGVWK